MAVPAIQVGSVVPVGKLLGKDDRGVNETFIGFVDLPSGRFRAYIKVLEGRQLVNELFATTLGRSLGLAIPEGCLVRARPSDLPDSVLLAKYGAEALLFASRQTAAPDLRRRMSSEGDAAAVTALFAAWKDWASCMTFDEWVANGDRHPGNVLFGGPDDIWLIDHSHCFTGPTWTAAQLVPHGIWRNQIADAKIPSLTLPERHEATKRVAAMIPTLAALDCPTVFTVSRAGAFMESVDAAALQGFVSTRVAHLYDILSNRLGIPNLGGTS